MRNICVAALACVLLPIRAHAQDIKESRVAPITVEVDAQLVAAGAPLLIRGRTLAVDTTKPVAIKVTWLRSLHANPAGPFPEPVQLRAPYRPDGTYAAYYSPDREGRYRAVVISPDGSARASVEFNVADPVDVVDAQAELVQKGLDISSQLVERMTAVIREQPVSPAQRDALRELQPLLEALSQHKLAVDQYRAGLKIYSQMAVQDPKLKSAFAPAYRQLSAWQREVTPLLPSLEQALAESRKSNVLCDQLIIVEEGFKLAELMFSLTNKFTKIVGFFREKSPATGALAQLSLKAKALTFAEDKLLDAIPGLAAKASGFVTHVIFDRYCERFEGPVLGKMTAEYYHNGEMWWRYTTNIEGKMTLAYRKGSDASKGVALKGHLVGTGTRFSVWEDALRVLHRKALAGGIVAGRTTSPVGIPFTGYPGAVAVGSSPTGFFIPIEGQLVGEKLKLELGPSRTDFNEIYTRARGAYVVGGVLSMGVLSFVTFEVSLDYARGIIDKATDADLGPIDIPVELTQDGLIAERTFNGRRGKVLAKGVYELKVKLCNPKC